MFENYVSSLNDWICNQKYLFSVEVFSFDVQNQNR